MSQNGENDASVYHDIENGETENANGRGRDGPRPSALQVILRVQKLDGNPLPPFLFHDDAIKDMCYLHSAVTPSEVEVLDEYEALLSYGQGVVLTPMVIQLCKGKVWYGLEVKITCRVASPELMERMHDIEYRQEMSRMDIFSNNGAHVQELSNRIMEKLISHMDERVDRLQDMVYRSQQDLKREVSQEIMDTLDQEQAARGYGGARPKETNGNQKKPPKISFFSGEEDRGKSEVSYAQWAYEVRMVRDNYTTECMREAVIKSLKGVAADLVRFLGPQATLDQILAKLETVYSVVSSFDTLMNSFFNEKQKERESVQQFATRIESILNEIGLQFPDQLNPQQIRDRLRDRLFHGMKENLRNTIRFRYCDPTVSYEELLVYTRKTEAEAQRSPSMRVTSKAAEVLVEGEEEVEVEELEDQFVMMAITGDNRGATKRRIVPVSVLNKRKTFQQNAVTNEDSADPEEPKRSRSSLTISSRKDDKKRGPQCWACQGYGHLSRNCPNRLNFNRRRDNAPNRPPGNQNQNQNQSQQNNQQQQNQQQNQKQEKRDANQQSSSQ